MRSKADSRLATSAMFRWMRMVSGKRQSMDRNDDENNRVLRRRANWPVLVLEVEVRWSSLKFAGIWLNNMVAMVIPQ